MSAAGLRLGLVLLLLAASSGPARASSDVQLRVIVPQAVVRSGPGFTYRELYRAERGEVMAVRGRSDRYWFRVVLPDGRYGWIYGEQVIPFQVDVGASGASRAWTAVKETLFAPSPIPGAHVGLTFSGGAIGGDGAFVFRPSVLLDDWFAIEGHVAEAVGSDGSLLLYGVDGQLLLWPAGPFVPFVALGGGGATSFPKVNGVTQTAASQFALDAGGGIAVVFRKTIVLRFDFRNYTLFTPNATSNRQEYSGGLSIYF